MPGNSNNQKVTLESLLHLKKSERPKAEFWESFEKDFDRRRLSALVEPPTWRDVIISPAFRVLSLGLPAIALVVMALLWSPAERVVPSRLVIAEAADPINEPAIQVDTVAQVAQPAPLLMDLDATQASSQFVVDAIRDVAGSSMQFRKVLYSPAIRLSVPSGAFYVRDNLSTSNYKVTTADVKLGRNF